MLIIHIPTIQKLREQQKEFDIDEMSSTSVTAVDILNQLFYKETDAVKLIMSLSFFPQSYNDNPTAWRDNHENKVKFEYLYVKKEKRNLIIYASRFKILSNFTKRLRFELEEYQEAKIKIADIPLSYQINPYQITRRLKVKAKVTNITPTHITWKLRPTAQ